MFSSRASSESDGDGTGIAAVKDALTNKEAKDQTIVLQALDPRPEVCKVQLEILNLQKRTLELQEAKLMLEIKKLQQGEGAVKQEKEGTSSASTSMAPVAQTVVDESSVMEVPHMVQSDQNIIYIH